MLSIDLAFGLFLGLELWLFSKHDKKQLIYYFLFGLCIGLIFSLLFSGTPHAQ
jgi:hypothetical protein